MKIAVISMIRDSWGGSEELWYDMAKSALAEGHTVMHLSYETKDEHKKMTELVSKGLLKFTRPGYQPIGSNRITNLFRLFHYYVRKKTNQSLNKIFALAPDIIVYNGTCYSIAEEKELISKLKENKTKFYIIGHLNSEKASWVTGTAIDLVRDMYQRAKKVCFISERSKQVAEKDLGTTIDNAIVVRNPVNMPATSEISFPKQVQIQFASVGNLVISHKGQDILLQIISKPVWRERNVHLNIYGDGKDKDLLEKMIMELQIKDQVTIHGKVSDIRAVWEKNHLLLMPSHMEGMPLAIVEAMLCGRPTVANDVGGITEWLEDGYTGFISQEDNMDQFAQTMERAWKIKGLWEKMGLDARQRALQLYDPNPGKTFLKLIQE